MLDKAVDAGFALLITGDKSMEQEPSRSRLCPGTTPSAPV